MLFSLPGSWRVQIQTWERKVCWIETKSWRWCFSRFLEVAKTEAVTGGLVQEDTIQYNNVYSCRQMKSQM